MSRLQFLVQCRVYVKSVVPRAPDGRCLSALAMAVAGSGHLLATCHSRVCVRCHPRPHDGGDQVLSDTGDAGAAAASVTRDRRASGKYSSTATRGQAAAPGRCSCSGAASLQWQWPSPLVPSCRLQCCTTNSKQQRPGPAGSVAKSWLFSHLQQQNLIHTLKWNIFFFFAVGITGSRYYDSASSAILANESHYARHYSFASLQTPSSSQTREKNGESKVDGLSYNGT